MKDRCYQKSLQRNILMAQTHYDANNVHFHYSPRLLLQNQKRVEFHLPQWKVALKDAMQKIHADECNNQTRQHLMALNDKSPGLQ